GARVRDDLVGRHDPRTERRLDATADAGSTVAKAPVRGVLEREAAPQTAAEPRDAPRAHGQILVLGHAQRDRLLVGREPAAAGLSTTKALDSAQTRTPPAATR